MKFELICRVCLKEGEMKPLFNTHKTDGESKVYCSEMLNICTTQEVTPSDGYPSQICKHCFNKLWSAYKFRRLCDASYDLLTSYILENKQDVKDIKTEVNDDSPLIEFVERKLVETVTCNKECDEVPVIKHEEITVEDEKVDLGFQDSYFMDVFVGEEQDNNFFNDNDYEFPDKKEKKKKPKKNSVKSFHSDERGVKRIPCSQCSKKFKNYLSYLKHLDKHLLLENPEVEKRKSFQCELCPAKFNFKEILSKHETSHTGKAKHSSLREDMPCTYCSKIFKNKLCLEKHMNKHTGVNKSLEKMFVCTYCSRSVKDKTMLRKHEASHLGLKPYYCETCKKSYRSEVDHKAYCGLELNYKCDYCMKCFKTKSRLISHIVVHNINRKKFTCDYEGCRKEFISAAGILKHKKLHTGEKIMCHLCSKEFNDKYLLQIHVNRHNNERKYPCSYCEKRFFSSGAKLEHERRHTNTRNFACTQCDKRFVSSTNLKRHTLWHEKNFNEQCRFCEKKFLVRGNRQTHEAIMHGVTKTVDESKYFCQQRLKATRLPKVCIDT